MSSEHRLLADRYRVEDLIGEGGMARVYRGMDEKLGRAIAIKILKRDLAGDEVFRNRFRLEAQAASRMAHPSIVRVYDAGEDVETDGARTVRTPFIVMEYVQGTLLKDIISRGPVPVEDAVGYVDGILEALTYSHRAGVIHRDIKPANVMVTGDGKIKVMDFGIARAISDTSATVAETTTILGTAAYFSPEQAKGETVDARADIYSTGIVLYELLTGRPPFRGDSPVAVAYQHVSETPEAPSEVNPQSPLAIDAVVLRALAKDPYQRHPDATSFREDLDAAAHGKTPTKRAITNLTDTLYGPNPRQAQETARSLRQLSTDTTMTRTQSGPPVAWIWGGVAFLAVLVVSVLIWVITLQPISVLPSSSKIVPDVTDLSYEVAAGQLQDEELVIVQVSEPSLTIAEGNVIRTDPEAGTSVPAETEVTVVVSEGEQLAEVPELVGTSEEEARSALSSAKLQVGVITPRNDPGSAEGTVLEASSQPGDELSAGSEVSLVVATGRVAIKDYAGFTVTSATEELEALELTVEAAPDDSCKATDPNTIISQSVPAGDTKIHSTIELRYCNAP